MNIVFLGKPGSGKGTITTQIKEEGFKILPTGALLREEIKNKTEMGKELEKLFAEGKFAPEEFTNSIVEKFLDENKNQDILLDGYPRNKTQWEHIKDKIDAVVVIDCPNSVIKDRIINRLIHEPSGRVYNTKMNPPKKPNVDDITGEKLTKRSDDTEEVLNKRMEVYKDLTEPLIEIAKKDQGIKTFTIEDTSTITIDEQVKQITAFIQDTKENIYSSKNQSNRKRKIQ